MATNNSANFGTGTSGQVLTSNGTGVAPTFQSAGSSGGVSNSSALPPWVYLDTNFYWSPVNSSNLATIGFPLANQTYLLACGFERAFTLTSVSIRTTSYASNDLVRIGMYNMDSTDAAATSILVNFGLLTVTGTGVFSIGSLTQAVPAGWYYFALNFNSVNERYLGYVNSASTPVLYSLASPAPAGAFLYNNGAGTFPASISAATLTGKAVSPFPGLWIQGKY